MVARMMFSAVVRDMRSAGGAGSAGSAVDRQVDHVTPEVRRSARPSPRPSTSGAALDREHETRLHADLLGEPVGRTLEALRGVDDRHVDDLAAIERADVDVAEVFEQLRRPGVAAPPTFAALTTSTSISDRSGSRTDVVRRRRRCVGAVVVVVVVLVVVVDSIECRPVRCRRVRCRRDRSRPARWRRARCRPGSVVAGRARWTLGGGGHLDRRVLGDRAGHAGDRHAGADAQDDDNDVDPHLSFHDRTRLPDHSHRTGGPTAYSRRR